MSELQVIESTLRLAGRRQRWARAQRGMWLGLLVGAIAALLVSGLYHLRDLPLWVLVIVAGVPFPFMLAGLVIGWWRRPAINEVARWVDGRQKLQERLSTALEVAATEKAGKWRDLGVTDAAGHAKEIDPRALLPFSLPWKPPRWGP